MLQNMQKKLEDLCEQMYSSKDQPKNHAHKNSLESDIFRDYRMPEKKDADLCSCGRSLPQLNPESVIPPHSGNLSNWEKVGTCQLSMELFSLSLFCLIIVCCFYTGCWDRIW